MTTAGPPYLPVLVLADPPEAAEPLCAALGARLGWARLGSMDLPSRISRLLWGFEAGGGDAGVSSLVDRERMTAELRRLVDGLVVAAVGGASYAVDVSGNGDVLGPYLRSVWGDAVVVAVCDGEPGEGVIAAKPDVVVSVARVAADGAAVAAEVAALAESRRGVVGDRVRAGRGRARRAAASRFRVSASPLRDRVIVVLGAARSGTTLLHRLISAHPMVAGTETGETWLFTDIAPVWAEPVREQSGDGAVLSGMRGFCDSLLLTMRDRIAPDATHVCEKTPTTVWRLPVLALMYPDALYVHVVRDGRDVAASLARTWTGGADPGVEEVEAAAREWVEAVGAVRRAAPELRRFQQVRYEDLIDDPQGVVERLWRWVGVGVSDAAREAAARRSTERVTPLPATGQIGTGKWRSLSAPARAAVSLATGDLMRELGYPADLS
ncbi:MAG TPA: sulfotransferase [Mycobacteriales bacterium]|nr:sulfotransferase [Mycobacteriales bacterium]HWC34252.1 sulfotransferase [Mycobacteriales bacterium]